MCDIHTTQENRIPCKELTGKALNDHANQLFQMYSGETVAVKMRFHNSLATVIIDRFGPDQMYIPDGSEHFVFTVNIAVSPMFLSWIVGFGTKAKILHPVSAIEECRKMCLDVAAQYSSNE